MKIMKDYTNPDYIKVYNEGDVETQYLLGWKASPKSCWMRVEDNLVNRMVLGLPVETHIPLQQLNAAPKGLLFEYQYSDVLKLCSCQHALNANPMGLGKTLETIICLKELNHSSRVLILCPKSVTVQWAQEIAKWWPEVEDQIQVLPKRVSGDKIVIMNYEQAASPTMLQQLKSIPWMVVVCDEAHRIKNRTSKRTQAVWSLPCQRRMALTGTPILNKPDDLWSILHWLDWRYAGKSYWNFVEYFCEVEDGYFGKSIKGIIPDVEKQAILNKLLEFFTVRNRVEVSQGKTIEVIALKMGTKQQQLYNQARNLLFEELPKTLTIANGAVLLTRLQQVTSNPQLFDPTYPNVKFEWIQEFLEDHPEEKIVVFTRFAETLKSLQSRLGSKCVVYHGQVKPEERVQAVATFQQDAAVQCLIGTIGALGVGVDGLQKVARIGVFIDKDWSPALLEQAEDRLNRMGQTLPVLIYHLDCVNTVDKYVGKVNLKKREDIEKCLGE